MSENLKSAPVASEKLEEAANQESAHGAHGGHQVTVIAHVQGHGAEEFAIPRNATLLDLMAEGARFAGFSLLPPGDHPFDRLHQGDELGTAIGDLNQTIGEYLRHFMGAPHFMIELVQTFRVNVRWDVAPQPELSPRDILALPRIHLDYKEFTLYLPDKNDPLPLDTPVAVQRGADFEAQRDGRYGQGPSR